MSVTPATPPGLETVGLTMRFGDFTALDGVTMRVRPGSFHALLGENGAGKSTLVKCVMGVNRPTGGALIVAGREADIRSPRDAHAHGLGMVYQHFTLVPSLTGAENLVIAREGVPAVIDWPRERAALSAFMAGMPFAVPLDRRTDTLSAGERQKLEILKQMYLGHRFLILDEPTSVLTPAEADDVLGHVHSMTRTGALTVLMITHKFREVRTYADDVTVLRRGRLAGTGAAADLDDAALAEMMMGPTLPAAALARDGAPGDVMLAMTGVTARDGGQGTIAIDDLRVRAREIVGVAGISGNGQVALMDLLTGLRRRTAGKVEVGGASWRADRDDARRHGVRFLPEEPLRNACAPDMALGDNLALRVFDRDRGVLLHRRSLAAHAADLAARFDIRARSLRDPIRTLSGGNVQRAALARELTGDVRLLVVANPCFGLDFAAARAIRDRIMAARNAGTAVLLISEDLDELMELSDRIVVMSGGRIIHDTPRAGASAAALGSFMAGGRACA